MRIFALCILVVAGAFPASAAAQAYPARPIRLLVPYAPGGNTDIVARTFGQKLSERVGQPVIFDNRGGAAGSLGLGVAAKAAADGYNITIGDLGSMVITGHTNPNRDYQLRDFAPISLVTSVSVVVTVNPRSNLNSIAELIAAARANPGKLTFATSGIGSPNHLAIELMKSMTGIQFLHVPFKGGPQAITAILGGEVDVLFDGSAFAQVRGGKLRAIGVTGPRLPALPDVPGIGETVRGFEFTNWWGMLAPAGTPAEVVRKLNEEFTAIAALPEIRERLTNLGLAARNSTPQEFGDFIRNETDKVARIVREANIKFD
ncbi:MAG: tripartite tricarboxylate transporter substrate binding protein [Burkholderiales bacterium]|nr:tripartite tricarboxylate transporter substrate binding protein [Burkholderiales bacterium]